MISRQFTKFFQNQVDFTRCGAYAGRLVLLLDLNGNLSSQIKTPSRQLSPVGG